MILLIKSVILLCLWLDDGTMLIHEARLFVSLVMRKIVKKVYFMPIMGL